MNTNEVAVSESTPNGKSTTELWEAVARSLDRILAVLTEREARLARPEEAVAAVDIYAGALGDIARLAEAHASAGLEAVSRSMLQHVRDLQAQGQGLGHDDLIFLEQWPIHLATFLADPRNADAAVALIEHLQDGHWPNPLPAGEGEVVFELLQLPPGSAPPPADEAVAPVVEDAAQSDVEISDAADLSDEEPLVEDVIDVAAPVADAPETEETNNAGTMVMPAPDADAVLTEVATLIETAEAFGLLGLQEICQRVQHNIEHYQATNGLDAAVLAQLEQFVRLAHDFLAEPAGADALIALLREAHWALPLSEDEAEGLLFLLRDGMGEAEPTSGAESAALTAESPTTAVEPVAEQQTVSVIEDIEAVAKEAVAAAEADTDLDVEAVNAAIAAELMGDEALVPAPQTVNVELIGLLTQELEGIHEELAHLLATALSPDASVTQRQEAIGNYAELLERLSVAADAVGLLALNSLIKALYGRVQVAAVSGLTTRQHEVLTLLPGSLLAYLAAPDDPSTGAGLLDLLQGDIWTPPPAADYIKALLRGLAMVQLTQDSPDKVVRQTQATAEDVVLTLPADLNQELLDGLLHELPVHTGEFSAAIQRLAAGNGTMADIDVAKRAAHTLKGAANTVGIKGIATLTHHVEDILVALSKHETLPNRALSAMLSNAGDCLEAMGEAVMGSGPEPDYAIGVLQEVLDWANRIDQDGVPPADADTDAALPASNAEMPQTEAETAAAAAVSHESMVRVPANLIDELLRLMGESIISTGQVRERLRRLVQHNKTLQSQNLVFLQLATELEDQVDLGGAGRVAGVVGGNETFDPLEFEHYSELHTISRRLIEAATDSGELSRDTERELSDLNELVEVQTRLNNQSQNTVLRTRMVPVATIASRLQRSVRQAARLLDKQVLLSVSGVDTMIDSNILNDLVDPLMHMLRNSVDHGIEEMQLRTSRGKRAEGHIDLSFSREGNQVVVRCRDDGAGLDLTHIRRSAEVKGLLGAGQVMSDDELARLIFAPGFSTRDESTQVSGRGIGMDVVYSRVLQLKGTINLYANPGQGMEIEIRLPATLISTYALLVRAQQHVFAISSYGITDIHYVTGDQVQSIGDEQFFRLGDEVYPLADFSALLHLPASRRHDERIDGYPVLLVRQDNGVVHAVRVQEIVDSSELVVKGLGRYVPKPQGVVGATILGDGSVAAVIDLPEVMRKPVRRADGFEPSVAAIARGESSAERRSHFTALVVDDSLSARRATAQFMKDAGFEVRTAIDGLEAVSILDKWKPDILLVDMEMPRMNGLELTAHVRARPGMTGMPVIMITSRSTEKHRRQAESAGVNVYLTKPFGDEQLLKHVMELTAH